MPTKGIVNTLLELLWSVHVPFRGFIDTASHLSQIQKTPKGGRMAFSSQICNTL